MVIYVNSLYAFYLYLREDTNQYKPNIHSHMTNIYQKLIDEHIMKENESIVCEERDDFED